MNVGVTANFNDPQSVKSFPWKFFILIGVGIPFIFMLVGGGMLYWDYYRLQNWNDVSAEITFSEVSEYRSDGSMMYTPDIRYSYVVDEEEYDGFVNMSSSSWRSSSDETVAEYPVGKETTVKVNPDEPSDSFLPIPDYFLPLFFLGFGALMASIFASVGIYGIKKRQEVSMGIPPASPTQPSKL